MPFVNTPTSIAAVAKIDTANNVLTGFEKANYWEHITDPRIERHLGRDTEICFMWEDDFEYKFYHVGEVVGCHCEAKYPLMFEIDDLFIP